MSGFTGYTPTFGTGSVPTPGIVGTSPSLVTKAVYLEGTPDGVPAGVLPAGPVGGPVDPGETPVPRLTLPGAPLLGTGDAALVPTIFEAND